MADLTSLLSRFLTFLPHFSGHVGGALNVDVAAVGNITTGTDTLITYTLPANVLNANGRTLRITAWGTTANTAAAKQLVMVFGSQTIMTQALSVNLAGTWRIIAYVVRTGAATQDIFAELFQLSTVIDKHTITAGTQDDTATITIMCTGAATNTDDIVQQGLIVEILA